MLKVKVTRVGFHSVMTRTSATIGGACLGGLPTMTTHQSARRASSVSLWFVGRVYQVFGVVGSFQSWTTTTTYSFTANAMTEMGISWTLSLPHQTTSGSQQRWTTQDGARPAANTDNLHVEKNVQGEWQALSEVVEHIYS